MNIVLREPKLLFDTFSKKLLFDTDECGLAFFSSSNYAFVNFYQIDK